MGAKHFKSVVRFSFMLCLQIKKIPMQKEYDNILVIKLF